MLQETKYYELSYLLRPSLAADDVSAAETAIRSLLGSYEATVDTWDTPKRRSLPYPIKKATDAYFGAIRFTTQREYAPSIQEKLREDGNVLRFTLLEWKKQLPRKPMKAKVLTQKEEQVPTDIKALDEKLEALFGENAPGSGETQPHESQ